MATTEYDFSLARDEIIEAALRKIGALYHGETMTAEMVDQGITALNVMIKSWQNQHVFLWTVQELSLVFSAGVPNSQFTLDPAIVDIYNARYIDSNDDEHRLERITFLEYKDIVDKAASGSPSVIALDGQLQPTGFIWPVPSTNTIVAFSAITKLKDFDTAVDTGGFTSRYLEALIYGLAYYLAPEFRIPLQERSVLKAESMAAFDLAKRSDSEKRDSEGVCGSYSVRRRR